MTMLAQLVEQTERSASAERRVAELEGALRTVLDHADFLLARAVESGGRLGSVSIERDVLAACRAMLDAARPVKPPERSFRAREALVANFRIDPAAIAENRALLEAATAEATTAGDAAKAALAMARALEQTNHLLCVHLGTTTYSDANDVVCTECPHCGRVQ